MLDSVCTFSAEGIVLTDSRHTIRFVNNAFQEIAGYAPQELVGTSINRFRSDSYEDSYYTEILRRVAEHGSWSGSLWSTRKCGEYFFFKVTILGIASDAEQYYCYLVNDTSRIREAEAKLQHSVQHDALTSLPNRMLLQDRIELAIVQAALKNRGLGLLIVDLDDFKTINDGMGHTVGDEVLKIAAARVSSAVRIGDSVARTGGDEFTVLLPDIRTPDDAGEIAQRIIELLSEPFTVDSSVIYLGATVGASIYPDDGTTSQDLLSNADLALIRAKTHCKGYHHFYTPDLNERVQHRIYLEETVRTALDEQMIQVYFQPVIDMETGRLSSSEALARLFHPERGEIPPGQFIPLAEENGLIYRLGEYVFRQACSQYAAWLELGVVDASVGINLSARQFIQPNLVDNLLGILQETGLSPDRVTIEITENSLMQDIDESVRTLRRFKDAGLQISIDDFGTGYSSLSYLKTLPVDQLKIDRSFIRDLMVRDNQAAIVTAIISMAHSMHMRVVAEGVETKQQFDFLKQSSCDYVQGYYFSKPLSVIHAQPHFEKETVFFYGT
ncbi:putative bifunctional diguanylate cyclase/phosphodiesterase [Spirochaeta africana]|nr:EAL domain-containing protein [Spirochaeta africana]